VPVKDSRTMATRRSAIIVWLHWKNIVELGPSCSAQESSDRISHLRPLSTFTHLRLSVGGGGGQGPRAMSAEAVGLQAILGRTVPIRQFLIQSCHRRGTATSHERDTLIRPDAARRDRTPGD